MDEGGGGIRGSQQGHFQIQPGGGERAVAGAAGAEAAGDEGVARAFDVGAHVDLGVGLGDGVVQHALDAGQACVVGTFDVIDLPRGFDDVSAVLGGDGRAVVGRGWRGLRAGDQEHQRESDRATGDGHVCILCRFSTAERGTLVGYSLTIGVVVHSTVFSTCSICSSAARSPCG